MKIDALDTITLKIPYDFGAPPRGFGGEDWSQLSVVMVRLRSADGATGWGEAFSYNAEEAVVSVIENMIAPLVVGQTVDDIEKFSLMLQQRVHLFGRYGITMFALSGVDIALWDLAAKQADKSLARFLNDDAVDRLEAYASLFRYQEVETVAERSAHALHLGYTRVKLHETGLAEIRAAREAIGDTPLMLDVNCPWSEAEVMALAPHLQEVSPYWLEEPIFPPEDFATLARVGEKTGIALAAGENACTSMEFDRMIDARAVEFVQPSVTKVGGVSEFIKVAGRVESTGLSLMPHSPYFGPGFLATLHLVAALDPGALVERFFADGEGKLFGDWTEAAGGYFNVPTGPGLGADPDPDVIRDYRVGPAS